jgi:hypothetical protein
VLTAVELALEAGAPTKTHILNLLSTPNRPSFFWGSSTMAPRKCGAGESPSVLASAFSPISSQRRSH